MPVDVFLENDTFVCQLRDALAEGVAGLGDVPMLLKRIIDEDRWQHRKIKTGAEPDFVRFEDFVKTPPLEGLGADIEMLRRMCRDDKVALDMIGEAIKKGEKQGERTDLFSGLDDNESANVNFLANGQEVKGSECELGNNTVARALRRLRSDRPDLHARVLAKEISAHAAMVEAGFRPKTLTVPATPDGAARILRRHFDAAGIAELVRLLTEPTP
jgi:hypothetical protein